MKLRLSPFPGAHIFTPTPELEFGDVEINTSSDTLSLILANYGENQLTINSIADSTGPFKLLTQLTFPLNLNSYDSLTIQLSFAPKIPGVFNVIMDMVSNDLNFPGVTLNGRAYQITPTSTNILYASSGINNGGSTLTIDLLNGSGTPIGPSLFDEVKSISIHPKTKIMYGVVNLQSESQLVYYNALGGDSYLLHTLSIPNFAGISFDTSGTLYGILKTGELYTIDLSDGSLTAVINVSANILGIAFNPLTNELWAAPSVVIGSNKDRIFKINITTGDTTVVGKTGFNTNHNDIVFDESGNLYAVTGSASQLSNFIQIDTSSGAGTLIGSVGYSNITGLAYLPTSPNSVKDNNVSSIPDDFMLKQNYPNPFNPSTTIEFSLPVSSNVKLTVYNILGEVVNVLIDNNLSAGTHSVNWNSTNKAGSKMVSGVYFFELKAHGNNGKEFSDMKKMILLK